MGRGLSDVGRPGSKAGTTTTAVFCQRLGKRRGYTKGSTLRRRQARQNSPPLPPVTRAHLRGAALSAIVITGPWTPAITLPGWLRARRCAACVLAERDFWTLWLWRGRRR